MTQKHVELFSSLRKYPEMYVQRAEFCSVAAFIEGYNLACEGGPLCGFTEWLALRANCGANWSWPSLVLHISEVGRDAEFPLTPNSDKTAIETLFTLFDQFSSERARPNGLSQIFAAYEKWRLAAVALK